MATTVNTIEWQRRHREEMKIYRLRWYFNNRESQLSIYREYSRQRYIKKMLEEA